MQSRRAELSADWVREQSRNVVKQAALLPELAGAERVGCYMAMSHEVETKELLERCWRSGKAVYVPAFRADRGVYVFSGPVTEENLVAGPLGILEPSSAIDIDVQELDLVFVPGVAFDEQGGRLGHGRGHYDRMLAEGAEVFKAGIVFDFQVVESVPFMERDVRMNAVITNTRVLRVTEQRSER